MIYAVSEDGPWVDLDEVVGVSMWGIAGIQVTFRNGVQFEAPCSIEDARKLGQAWIDHKAEEEGDGPPKRRKTL